MSVSSNSEFTTIRDEVTTLQSQLSIAKSKDEALELAITAAELCMKALKITTNKTDRFDIQSQCKFFLDEAEQIKASSWKSSQLSSHSAPLEEKTEINIPTSPRGLNESNSSHVSLPSKKEQSSPKALSTTLAPKSLTSDAHQLANIPKIIQLREPVSTRKLSTAEQLVVLKASKLNQFVFPPWKVPTLSEFRLGDSAMPFLDEPVLGLSKEQLRHFDGWRRSQHALPPPSMRSDDVVVPGPVMEPTNSIDLVQDIATDCSVVASLCSIVARSQRGHGKMLSHMIWPYDIANNRPVISSNGKYLIRLNFNGAWRRVEVDDVFPVSRSSRMLHVIDRQNPGLLWPPLIEKAYLKVRGGYDFPGSNSCSDLWALTGWIPEQLYLPNNDVVPNRLWKKLFNAFAYGDVLITLGTGKMGKKVERELGLEGHHNYSILDMKETDHGQLLLVKNPWVEGKGRRGGRLQQAYSNTKPISGSVDNLDPERRLSELPPPQQLGSSTFWINMENVVQHFEHLFLNWNPGLFRYRQDIHFGWNLEDTSNQFGCLIANPQFSLSLQTGGLVWLLLSRHYQDTDIIRINGTTYANDMMQPGGTEPSSSHSPNGFINLYCFDRGGHEVYVSEDVFERGSYVNTPQLLVQWELEAQRRYTLAVSQIDLPRQGYTFTLSAFSNSAIDLSRASVKYAVQKICEGTWGNETAGGNSNSPHYFDNPQFSLHISHATPVAICIQTPSSEHPIHIKLVHSRGQRVNSLQNRDIVVDSGEYRYGCAFAEISELSPGTYTFICSMFELHKQASFSLRVDTNSPETVLRRIPREGAGLLRNDLARAVFKADMNRVAAQIIPHRLVRVLIVTRFLRAIDPAKRYTKGAEGNSDLSSRSPLRITIEQGTGPNKRILVSSSEGEYSEKEIVRTNHVDLNPQILIDGDVWLVIDRLSGPAAGAEEWYNVEMFSDAPTAVTVGAWRGWDNF